MPEITIANLQSKTIRGENKSERLLDVLLRETDWMHACGGKGRCTTCKARILKGLDQLAPRTEHEERFFKMNKLQPDERLTCQVEVAGDLTLEVPNETQLPHLVYQ